MTAWTLHRRLAAAGILSLMIAPEAAAQFGGGMGGMGGGGGGGANAPAGPEKPKFRDVVIERGGPRLSKEDGGKLVAEVEVVGNRVVDRNQIDALLETRKDRTYDEDVVMQDVRRLYRIGAFQKVSREVVDHPEGVVVRFLVEERPTVSVVEFHGNRRMNERELKGRVGLAPKDPLNEYVIESARRRLLEYYQSEGFNQAAISAIQGVEGDPYAVVFRINEGPLERVGSLQIKGAKFISESRLKRVIKTRGHFYGVPRYWGNRADLQQIEDDVQLLTRYYRNLGFFEAKVGRVIDYDESGKWMNVTFVIDEGPQYTVADVQIEGNRYFQTSSLEHQLELLAGEPFNEGKMNADVRRLADAYGSQGFVFADVQARPTFLDERGKLVLVYNIREGDRYKCSEIRVHIEGDNQHTKEHTIINRMAGVAPGQILDKRAIESAERRIKASGLFETNPATADPPRIEIRPPEEVDDF